MRWSTSNGVLIQGTLAMVKWWHAVDPRYKKLLLGLGISLLLMIAILGIWKLPQRQLAPLKAKIQRETKPVAK
jgi:type II secretory pathway component PulM